MNQHGMRLLVEKVSNQPETLDMEDNLVEFSLPSWQVMTLTYSGPREKFHCGLSILVSGIDLNINYLVSVTMNVGVLRHVL